MRAVGIGSGFHCPHARTRTIAGAMTINEAVSAIDQWLRTYEGVASASVHASGDDTDVIKIRVDLGSAAVDPRAWATRCEAAIREVIPETAPFRLQVRAESD